MLNKKEAITIIITTLVLDFTISLFSLRETFLPMLLTIFIVIFANLLTKKTMSAFLDTEIEIKPWEFTRWGFKKHFRSQKPISAGLFIPPIIKIISAGFLNWTAALVFDVKAKVYRTAKRHGLYAFSDISEAQIGAIAASGIIVNLILALAGYLVGFEDFARLSLGFAFYNLIPISNLDGNKIFFGSLLLWTVLATITLLGVAAMILII
ncbi:MAG: hypothetical protein KC516_00555 [Nanoarchaeota archaeon]|nr:hypothetical protein [Nanoarchaeota archaeon]